MALLAGSRQRNARLAREGEGKGRAGARLEEASAAGARKLETSRGAGGGCSGSGTLPNSDEPMIDISLRIRAGEGPKRGHFVSVENREFTGRGRLRRPPLRLISQL